MIEPGARAEGLHGTWFVVPTPFGADGSVDVDSQRRLVEAAIEWGVDGLTLMGVTSEAPALSEGERREALEAAADVVGGRIPLVVGCSAASEPAVLDRMDQAGKLGALAAMVSAPPLLRNVDSLPDFFHRVAQEGPLPIVVQDEPAATGVTIPLSVLLRCVESSGARVVKLEDPPTPPKISRLLQSLPDLQVFGGLGGTFALTELSRGACGTMTGFAFPEVLRAVRIGVASGEVRGAARTFDRYLPLIQYEAQQGVGLAIRKELLRRRGVIGTNVTRGPVRAVDEPTMAELDEVLERVGVVPGPERMEVT